MLILTRKLNESIIVQFSDGTIVAFQIAKIDNDRVKIGIDAPQKVRIFRQEVYNAIKESNFSAQVKTSDTEILSISKIPELKNLASQKIEVKNGATPGYRNP